MPFNSQDSWDLEMLSKLAQGHRAKWWSQEEKRKTYTLVIYARNGTSGKFITQNLVACDLRKGDNLLH